MELLEHLSLMNLANEQPFLPKSNTGQVGSEKGDVLLWGLPLLAWNHTALRYVFQTPEVQAFDLGGNCVGGMLETMVLYSENRVSQNLATSFARIHGAPSGVMARALNFSRCYLLNRQNTQLLKNGGFRVLSLWFLRVKSFLSHCGPGPWMTPPLLARQGEELVVLCDPNSELGSSCRGLHIMQQPIFL